MSTLNLQPISKSVKIFSALNSYLQIVLDQGASHETNEKIAFLLKMADSESKNIDESIEHNIVLDPANLYGPIMGLREEALKTETIAIKSYNKILEKRKRNYKILIGTVDVVMFLLEATTNKNKQPYRLERTNNGYELVRTSYPNPFKGDHKLYKFDKILLPKSSVLEVLLNRLKAHIKTVLSICDKVLSRIESWRILFDEFNNDKYIIDPALCIKICDTINDRLIVATDPIYFINFLNLRPIDKPIEKIARKDLQIVFLIKALNNIVNETSVNGKIWRDIILRRFRISNKYFDSQQSHFESKSKIKTKGKSSELVVEISEIIKAWKDEIH